MEPLKDSLPMQEAKPIYVQTPNGLQEGELAIQMEFTNITDVDCDVNVMFYGSTDKQKGLKLLKAVVRSIEKELVAENLITPTKTWWQKLLNL